MANTGRPLTRIAQLGSALAVVLSLVFVGLQVREASRQTALNTEALQLAAYQDLIGQIGELNRLLVEPAAADLFERLLAPDGDWAQFSQTDRRRGRSMLVLIARHADMAYYQYERGVLSRDRLESALAPWLILADRPLYRSFWEDVRMSFVPSFRDYMDSRVREVR